MPSAGLARLQTRRARLVSSASDGVEGQLPVRPERPRLRDLAGGCGRGAAVRDRAAWRPGRAPSRRIERPQLVDDHARVVEQHRLGRIGLERGDRAAGHRQQDLGGALLVDRLQRRQSLLEQQLAHLVDAVRVLELAPPRRTAADTRPDRSSREQLRWRGSRSLGQSGSLRRTWRVQSRLRMRPGSREACVLVRRRAMRSSPSLVGHLWSSAGPTRILNRASCGRCLRRCAQKPCSACSLRRTRMRLRVSRNLPAQTRTFCVRRCDGGRTLLVNEYATGRLGICASVSAAAADVGEVGLLKKSLRSARSH